DVDAVAHGARDGRVVAEPVARRAEQVAEAEATLGAADRSEALADRLEQLDDERLPAPQHRGLAQEADHPVRLVGVRPAGQAVAERAELLVRRLALGLVGAALLEELEQRADRGAGERALGIGAGEGRRGGRGGELEAAPRGRALRREAREV